MNLATSNQVLETRRGQQQEIDKRPAAGGRRVKQGLYLESMTSLSVSFCLEREGRVGVLKFTAKNYT